MSRDHHSGPPRRDAAFPADSAVVRPLRRFAPSLLCVGLLTAFVGSLFGCEPMPDPQTAANVKPLLADEPKVDPDFVDKGGRKGGSKNYFPCSNKDCGEDCTICSPEDTGCAEVLVLRHCNQTGECVLAHDAKCGG